MKYILIALALTFGMMFCGCEKDTVTIINVPSEVEEAPEPSPEYTITDVVIGKGDVLNPQTDDISQLQLEDVAFEVVVTTSTQIQHMRGSGSGFSNGSINDIKIGDTVECKYNADDTDYTTSPVVIRANSIRAW